MRRSEILWDRVVKPILSEPDNRTLSFIRIGAVLFGAAAIILATISTVAGHAFDPSGFLMGAATLLGGAGVGAKFSEGDARRDEPLE